MMDDSPMSEQQETSQPRWQPLSAVERRLAGVLVEKAKTTPDGYPMSLKAICTAANQKSNRAPQMNLEPDDVEESLERLRELGAVGMIEGYGRVAKYRHYLYEWLAVDKVELAVMAELLLRGAQTEGDLRARAARMEPVGDVSALRPVLASLKAKELVVPLNAEGRGHMVTHALYPPQELERIQGQHTPDRGVAAQPLQSEPQPSPPAASFSQPAPGETQGVDQLRRDLTEVRSQVTQMRDDLDGLADELRRTADGLRELKDMLG